MALNTVAAGRAWLYSHTIGRQAQIGMGFTQPIGIAFANNGVIYVANRSGEAIPNIRISKVTLDEQFINEFGRRHFTWIGGVALDQAQDVYASDEWKGRISVFDGDGNILKTWGESGEGEGQLNGSSGLAFDSDDNLWVVNSFNGRIQNFSKDGRYLGGFGVKGSNVGELDMPWGIAVDVKGDLYVADWNNDRVQKFAPDGTPLAIFGQGGPGRGSLNHPTAVAVDQDGDVYVVDWMNERVVIYDSEGNLLTYLYGDAVDLSKWAQMQMESNPDMINARRRVYNLEEQQRKFRLPMGCAFHQETNTLIVCDTQRSRLQVYTKDNGFREPQFNL